MLFWPCKGFRASSPPYNVTTFASIKDSIVFEDTHLIVLSKPAGLLSQGESTGDENLVDLLRTYLGRNYVGLVHRLDRNTSGLMVVAKRSKSAQRLTDALQAGSLERSYLALLMGELAPAEQLWRHQLLKDENTNIVRVVRQGGKDASLKALQLSVHQKTAATFCLASFTLETGRSHQIRVQAAAQGHPLVGDLKYGAQKLPTALQTFPRPALHSYKISFPHPMTQEKLSFESELPADMKAFLK